MEERVGLLEEREQFRLLLGAEVRVHQSDPVAHVVRVLLNERQQQRNRLREALRAVQVVDQLHLTGVGENLLFVRREENLNRPPLARKAEEQVAGDVLHRGTRCLALGEHLLQGGPKRYAKRE